MTPTSQILFLELLKYFDHGDFSTFKRICDLLDVERTKTDRYFYSNMFTAANIAGLIEIEEADGIVNWSVSFDKDVSIQSFKSKIIATTKNAGDESPLILDFYKKPLIFGSRLSSSIGKESFYGSRFFSHFPKFQDVERDICSEEIFSYNLGKYCEAFDWADYRWKPCEIQKCEQGCLIRAHKDFFRVHHFIFIPHIRLLFRLQCSDWAFITAARLLKYGFSNLVHQFPGYVRIPRTVKLPTLLFRYLFASSELLTIGPSIQFDNLEPVALQEITKYFSSRGLRNAA